MCCCVVSVGQGQMRSVLSSVVSLCSVALWCEQICYFLCGFQHDIFACTAVLRRHLIFSLHIFNRSHSWQFISYSKMPSAITLKILQFFLHCANVAAALQMAVLRGTHVAGLRGTVPGQHHSTTLPFGAAAALLPPGLWQQQPVVPAGHGGALDSCVPSIDVSCACTQRLL